MPGLGVGVFHPLAHHADGHIVRDEFAFIHVLLGKLPQVRLLLQVLAEQIAGGHVSQAQRFFESRGLRAFAYAGRPKQDKVVGHCVSLPT